MSERCAEPQITPLCDQTGRPTIWDTRTGTLRRILAQISPWRPRPLNLNFFYHWASQIQGPDPENVFQLIAHDTIEIGVSPAP